MGLIAKLGDFIERRAQSRAYLKATGGNFESRLSQEERRILEERREARAVGRQAEEAEKLAQEDAQLISDRYRPELLFDNGEFFGFKPDFSTQDFLVRRKCFLAEWTDELGNRADRIIDMNCQEYQLDQRIILLSLQREQSAISARKPLPARTIKRILGFGALDVANDPTRSRDIPKFYGFRKQIANAARRYIELAKEWPQSRSITVDYGKTVVVPLNAPTWAMYRYTPHTGAGKLSYLIGRWFGF